MPYYYSTRQTFCILVMLIGISCTCKGRSINHNYTQSANGNVGVEAARERMSSNSKDSSERISYSTHVMEAAVERRRSNSKESRERMSSSACNGEEAARERMSGAKSREFRERKGTVEGVNWRELRERKGVNGRGLRERKSVDSRELRERMGADSSEVIDQQYMEWVKFMGSLRNHSLFGVAKNVFEIKSTLVVVDKSPGKGHFTTIQQAVNSVPTFNLFRVVIQINPGIYTEKVSIPWSKPYITFQGAGSNKTIIQWNDTAGSLGSDGKPLGTFNSATVAIDAPYFIARNLTFKNTAPWQLGEKNKQASAARVSGDASAFVGCQFLGAQDTLYDHKGRHFFQDCYIEGSVDFIFGDGLSMYQNCHMHAIGARYESITAQSRSNLLQDSGFSFVKCKVTGSGPLYLGRAWGTFSRVVYAYTYMDNIIVPEGWYNWGDPKREGTVYYGQYKCMGPGATTQGRVTWSRELTDEEAQPFLDLTFVDGDEWIGL